MTRTEYLVQLERHLKKLPQADYEEAMDYFTEYFDEAGPENEAQVIAELGTPKEAARELITRLLNEKTIDQEATPRTQATWIWIAILAVFASPIAFPLAILFLALLCTVVLLSFALILSLLAMGVALLLSSVSVFVDSISYFAISSSVATFGTGMGLLAFGLAILAILASIESTRACGNGIVSLTRWAVNKGRKS